MCDEFFFNNFLSFLYEDLKNMMKIGELGKRWGFNFGALEMWNVASSVVAVSEFQVGKKKKNEAGRLMISQRRKK